MASSEKIAVLKTIRTVKKEIQRLKAAEEHPAKKELEDVFIFLDDLEDELIFSELEKRVSEIEAVSNKLKKVIQAAKEKADDLQEIADKINKVTSLVAKLLDIFGKGTDFAL